jgi:hypothetical protein
MLYCFPERLIGVHVGPAYSQVYTLLVSSEEYNDINHIVKKNEVESVYLFFML